MSAGRRPVDLRFDPEGGTNESWQEKLPGEGVLVASGEEGKDRENLRDKREDYRT